LREIDSVRLATVKKERTQTFLLLQLSFNTVYSFVPERYPHKPYVKDGYPQNVTAVVNTTVTFMCPIYSDLEPYIQWVKTPHVYEEGTDSKEGNSTVLDQVREGMVQVQSVGATCTLAC
jgi:hypothetical protein